MPTSIEITGIHIVERNTSGPHETFSGSVEVDITGPYGTVTLEVEFSDLETMDAVYRRALYQVRDWTQEMASAAQNAVP